MSPIRTSYPAAIVMAVTLSACTTPLSKEAASIVTVRSDSAGSIVHDCRRLGTVEGGSSTVFGGAVGYNQATAEIKERAAAMGADTVVLTHHAENFSGTALTAVAYHCAKQ